MDTTAAEREVRTLPPLDREPLRREAEAWVARALDGITDPKEKVKAAGKLHLRAEAAMKASGVERGAVVWTLVTHYRLRRGAGLAAALGMQRSALQKVKDRAMANPPAEPVDDADKALPKVAKKAMRDMLREQAARRARDEAVRASGLSNVEAAELIGRDESRVSHIKHHEGTAA